MKVMFETKGNSNNLGKWLDGVTKNTPTRALNKVAREGEKNLYRDTPKDTGQTAAGWTAEVTTKGDAHEISWMNRAHPELSVNLAKLIDRGYGTGTGGYVPPRPYIKDSMDSVWKTAGDRIAEELIK